ncbi:response regulator [Cypionkella psychrotolerans]|uniref:response regulator n=1 Tax=Cypionkella psychrotolerans TaxID=1678131 RepID=UPI0006B431D1|nr:response regulator [Cypionkella psychrotolerans]
MLTQQMGGDIEVTSEPGVGSVFTLVLRLPRAAQNPVVRSVLTVAPLTNLRLLVAEDNRTNMLVTRKLLERSVASIDEAEADLPRCPIVALTAYASAEEAALCLAAGMDAVLTKPLIRAELYALLERTAAARDRFDLPPVHALDSNAKGGPSWSTSPHASGTTSGRSTRSSAR